MDDEEVVLEATFWEVENLIKEDAEYELGIKEGDDDDDEEDDNDEDDRTDSDGEEVDSISVSDRWGLEEP